MSWSSRKKKEGIFVSFILSEGNFLTFVFYLNVCIEYTFTRYILLYIKKTLLHTLVLLVFKIVESLQCILKEDFITVSKNRGELSKFKYQK